MSGQGRWPLPANVTAVWQTAAPSPPASHGAHLTHTDGHAAEATAEILDIVAAETAVPRDKLVSTATVDELGIASLDMVQAIFALETRFGIDIPVVADRTGGEFGTVGDLVDHVLGAIAAQTPPPVHGTP